MSSRWSSRVAYKTLPKSKWLLAAFKFTLSYLTLALALTLILALTLALNAGHCAEA